MSAPEHPKLPSKFVTTNQFIANSYPTMTNEIQYIFGDVMSFVSLLLYVFFLQTFLFSRIQYLCILNIDEILTKYVG